MHNKGQNWNNMTENRDLETKRDQDGISDRKIPPTNGGRRMLSTCC
jgi:hypothetical protein